MITIKEFASLCGCNTQILRYYDKIDLLKPVKVDPWSGYRYYEAAQAVDFVKIKSLQAADFTIGEIKALLTMHDDQVYEAFDGKIAEQTQKLARIKEIQQSYLTEVNTMKNLINAFCDYLVERVSNPEMLREFGMTAAEAGKMVEAVRTQMLTRTVESGEEPRTISMVIDDKLFEGPQAIENMTFLLKEEELDETVYLNADHIRRETADLTDNMDPVWEVHGWSFTHEFLGEIPELKDGQYYIIKVSHSNKSCYDTLTYPLFMIGSMLLRGCEPDHLHCFIDHSTDGQNHVTLYRRS